MSFQTAWVIGQTTAAAAFDVTFNGSPVSIPAGSYYLFDVSTSPTRSLLDALALYFGRACDITEAGKVKISGASFSITWGTGTGLLLRDLLGFDADVPSTTEAIGAIQSPLLWSPTFKAQTYTPPQVDAYPVPDTQVVASLTAKTVDHVTNFTQERQEFSWDAVPIERVWPVSDGLGQTSFRYFWSLVLQAGERWKVYEVTEDPSSTAGVSYALLAPLGPYKMRRVDPKWYTRGIPNADIVSPIAIEAVKVDEA